MSQNPDVTTDRRIQRTATIQINKATIPVGFQKGEFSGTTDGSGQVTVTFPIAFASTPTTVVATMSGAQYYVRIVSKSTTQAVLKVLGAQGTITVLTDATLVTGSALSAVSTASQQDVVGSLNKSTTTVGSVASSTSLFCSSSVGGLFDQPFLAPTSVVSKTVVTNVTANLTAVLFSVSQSFNTLGTSITSPTGSAASPVAPIVSTSVTIDWIAMP